MVYTRTIREAAAYFQAGDPYTCPTETAIRTLLRTGTVPSVRVSRKHFWALEVLKAYLAGSKGQKRPKEAESARVWKIK